LPTAFRVRTEWFANTKSARVILLLLPKSEWDSIRLFDVGDKIAALDMGADDFREPYLRSLQGLRCDPRGNVIELF